MFLIDSWHLIFLGTILAVCQAMPYHKNKINDHSKIFHDESSESLMPKEGDNKTKSEQVTPRTNAKWMHWNADKTLSRSSEDSSAVMRDIPDPCENVFCHVGRVCQPDELGNGQCVCGDAAMCLGHHRVVCGTNGVYYPSHCELHRMACLIDSHISTDLTNKACEDGLQNDELPKVGESVVKTLEASDKRQLPDREEDSMEDEDYDDDEEDDGSDEYLYEDEEEEDNEEDDGIEDDEDEDSRMEDSSVEDSSVEDSSEDSATKEDDGTSCSDEEYRKLKNNLLLYHCARIGDSDCTEEFKRKKFLASVMFNYYDHNSDSNLDATELHDIEHRDHLSQLSRSCGLGDMLSRDDTSGDDAISLEEFYAAFNIPTVVLDAHLRDFTTLVTVGSSIELKCDIKGSTDLIWKRNGARLDKVTGDDVKMFDDGSLYISNVGLRSIGNYTCQDVQNNDVVQTHIVKVQMPPSVEVRPSTQFHTSGSTVVLKCHADGIPQPQLSWEINESALPADNSTAHHYALLHANATLEIMHAAYTRDTGAYKCKARNSAGSSQDIATVFIEKSDVPPYTATSTQDSREVFVVFHDDGYTVYEPSHCYIEHQVSSDFSNFVLQPPYGASLHTLCDGEKPCSWGTAINVQNRFIYVSQPQLNRVIVIEIQKRSNPVEVIITDATPVRLQYVSHLDQVWVVCRKDNDSVGARSVVVIREASKGKRHGIVHPQSIADGLDQMDDVFLPPSNDLQETFDYGYAMKRGKEALYKLHLHSMQYVKTIDLTAHMCEPQAVTFIPIGGKVMVTCAPPSTGSKMSSHIMIDYITDEIVSHPDSGGDVYVSPDSRYIVVVESEGNTLTVTSVTDDGRLVYLYDAYSNVHVSAVTFFPCDSGRGYDLYASSKDKNDVLYMNLSSGKVEMIEGIGQPPKTSELSWDNHGRSIVASGVFGEYLMTVSRDAVVLIDGKRRHVQCEWQNIKNGNVIVWVDQARL